MANIDLRSYVVAKWGSWFGRPGNFAHEVLRLPFPNDGISLAGPLRVRVSVVALNQLNMVGSSSTTPTEREAFGYVLDIPPGQTWSYPHPQYRALLEQGALAPSDPSDPVTRGSGTGTSNASGQDTGQTLDRAALLSAALHLGTNAGFGITIRLAGPDICADPCAPDPCGAPDPCAPKSCSCGCQPCSCTTTGDAIPCNFATRGGSSLGCYFPSACEPCVPGAVVGMPPQLGAALLIPPATGGTVRTRYFNGMFITREDLETDQRNVRLKRALMNRAMGQGVVWGLDVCQDGNAICVLPGYGVDCCGNDVVLSAAYRVDADALVRDPAAAALLGRGTAQRMNLVLEYFECPEQPRPVHGDPCSPDVTRCEMSRIRETARLRLAPPCDVDDSGPIKDFLAQIEQLRTDRELSTFFETPPTRITPAQPQPIALPPTVVPFRLQIDVLLNNNSLGPLGPIEPPSKNAGAFVGDAPASTRAGAIGQMTASFASTNSAGYVFGTCSLTLLGATIQSQNLAGGLEWQFNLPSAGGAGSTLVLGWQVFDRQGIEYSGRTEIDLTTVAVFNPNTARDLGLATLHVVIPPTEASVKAPPAPAPPQRAFPCATEACDPAGSARFKVAPPWLHENPEIPGQAADPRVLALALTYAWTAAEQARAGVDASGALQRTAQLTLANALYNAVFKASFATVATTARYDLSTAVQKLLQAWCKSLLYPGPKCSCEPHGVVVGCARVEGGQIVMVDSWGGRRWVVHYPLLAHWGQQFGITPPDAIASKLFDIICCVAGLQKPDVGSDQNLRSMSFGTSSEVGRSANVPLGSSMLVFEAPSTLQARLASLQLQTVRSETLTPGAFALRIWNAVNAAAPAAGPGTKWVDYSPAGFPDVHLLTPDASARPSPVSAGTSGALTTILTDALSSAQQPVSLLLQPVSTDISQGILGSLLLTSTDDAQRAAATALAQAGVSTIADLLTRDPEALLAGPLQGANADAFSGVLTVAQTTARAVAVAVADTLAKGASAGVVSRADLNNATHTGPLSSALVDRLTALNIPAATIEQAVRSAAPKA